MGNIQRCVEELNIGQTLNGNDEWEANVDFEGVWRFVPAYLGLSLFNNSLLQFFIL